MSLFSKGNLKLGHDTMIFNITPATYCTSRQMGLCKVGSKCYAMKAERIYKAVLPYRLRQSAFWDVEDVPTFLNQFNKEKSKHIKYFRFNEAGDFRNQADVDKMSLIARALKTQGITTYGYTARTDLDFSKVEFVINGSSWMADNEFRYLPKGSAALPVMCPGDCRTCTLCKTKGGLVIGIAAH